MPQPGDARLEERLGAVLRVGVRASTAFLAAGLLLSFAGFGANLSALLLTIGLMTLVATPVARVLVSAIVYFAQRDWLFAALTAIVLLELMASVVAALVFHRRL